MTSPSPHLYSLSGSVLSVCGAMTTLLVHAGGEPVLIRVPDRPMPLPKPVSPDAYQSELEASGAVDRSMLEALLAASDD